MEKIKTPNARLLLIKTKGLATSWNEHRSLLMNFMGMNPKLSFANLKTYLYFFSSPDAQHFSEEESWVALEIVGQPQLEAQGKIQTLDLDQGEAFRFGVPIDFLPGPYFFNGLAEFYQKVRANLGAEPIAQTWRLVIEEISQDGRLIIKLNLDFFAQSPP